MLKKIPQLALLVFLITSSTAFARTIDMTGSLSDWGISPLKKDATKMDWDSPLSDVVSVVDPVRTNQGYLNPGWGPEFDAYAMYFSHDAVNAYFGIATSMAQGGRRDTFNLMPGRWIYPGDLALKFHNMENNSTYQIGVRLNISEGPHSGEGSLGGVYKVSEWSQVYEGLYPPHESSDPVLIKTTGAKLGDADVIYGTNTVLNGDPLFLYEVAIPLNLSISGPLFRTSDFSSSSNSLDWAGGFDAHWTMACGNDSLTMSNLSVTPEPVSTLLFLIGGAAFSTQRFFKKKQII